MIRAARLTILSIACLVAQQAQAIVTVSLCGVSTAGVAFGSYDPSSAVDTTGLGSITFGCLASGLGTLTYTITISAGNGTFLDRQMKAGTTRISYNLYQDSNRTILWGDGTGGSSIYNESLSIVVAGLFSKNYTVYGKIPALQLKPAGSYTDSVTVTVTF
ncbi:Csu type fimbrial protein [Undibacterium terreum]|uniref:Spore coat protein U/FanG domain-containing protein n=1 Tax=Undibacterium terreum TaxID=1224302 RepID=A0A916U5G6_9BURK|nr:spore coat U domain-containing protein [Undibacterium terreum]GGC59498.1 hypothetical protein GCM10011396_03010 [Undibacterium terreum]